jgi:hypothetical protein
MSVDWTHQRCMPLVRHAEELWLSGLSAQKIAEKMNEKFGVETTKNSIVGLRARQGWPARESPIKRIVARPISQVKKPEPITTPVILSLPTLPSLSSEPVRRPLLPTGPIAMADRPAWAMPPPEKKITVVVVCEAVAPEHQEDQPEPKVPQPPRTRRGDGSGCLWPVGKIGCCDEDLKRVFKPKLGASVLSSYCAAHYDMAYLTRKAPEKITA